MNRKLIENRAKRHIKVENSSDKLALINFLLCHIEEQKESGKSKDDIKKVLLEEYHFSDEFIEQLI